MRSFGTALALLLVAGSIHAADDDGFKPLFDWKVAGGQGPGGMGGGGDDEE